MGPNALWPTQPKFWVGHGPPGPRCSAPHVVMQAAADVNDNVAVGIDDIRSGTSNEMDITSAAVSTAGIVSVPLTGNHSANNEDGDNTV